MKLNITFKTLLIVVAIIAILAIIFFVHALAGLGSGPVTFAKPPVFVQEYAAKFGPLEVSPFSDSARAGVYDWEQKQPVPAKWTRDYFNEAALVRNVMLNDESPEKLISLFTHPEKEKRVKIAFAFGAVNIMMSHDDARSKARRRRARVYS